MQESYTEALRWLYGTQATGVKLGLENVRRLLDALGNPHRQLVCIHVAGTNGKGSVSAMLDAVGRAAGLRTGLYTSPHLVRFNERIQVSGQPITNEEMLAELSVVREAIARSGCIPTFFEITTALGFLHFVKQRVDLAIMENGLGGRLDATNLITPLVSVLTSIDLDHQKILGDSRGKIAREKAGIIKPGVPVVSIAQIGDVQEVIDEVAASLGSAVTYTTKPITDLQIGLAGSHQQLNAAVVRDALAVAKLDISSDALKSGLKSVFWPGRFQALGDRLTIDGAHNVAASQRLVQTWRECYAGASPTIVFGGLRDKDLDKMLAALTPIAARFFLVPVKNPRGENPASIGLPNGIPGAVFPAVQEAVEAARKLPEPILVTGSLFLAGEVLSWMRPELGEFETSWQ
ncbi:MAG TPA: folylpolyglutamate synthase/dihydrofolate synthase family protein [Chthoniobacterales bacterium]|nr:folylpolyglutamate synthase/dihydrofolate synthase family protein [Chthoniobacterales bacterium]